jgi:formylglycine-generating enzyme required for sulfatase activity
MDATPVTNAQFRTFVKETGFETTAEKEIDPKEVPGARKEQLQPGSIVFNPQAKATSLRDHLVWWRFVHGAQWRHPEGPGSSIDKLSDHPVVHVSWDDAKAYCQWAEGRLPTEAEYEYAARGGLDGKRYAWGDELKPGGRWPANIWQGTFPVNNSGEDGFIGSSPVTKFPPNSYGLYDMAGNVWHWTADFYRSDYFTSLADKTAVNPQGPDDSHDPTEPGIVKRVQKGGSYLCSEGYCTRYLVGSRGRGEPSSSSSHIGFRCVATVK